VAAGVRQTAPERLRVVRVAGHQPTENTVLLEHGEQFPGHESGEPYDPTALGERPFAMRSRQDQQARSGRRADLADDLGLLTADHVCTAQGGRPSCLLVPSKVDRRTSLGRQASTSLAQLGWAVGPALGQRTAHSEAFRAAKWIGAHAPGSAAEMEVRALVERVEAQLERCPPATHDHRPACVHADAPMAAAAGRKASPGAPVRIGAYCHSVMATVLAKLRRAEQQAFY
jgi:hypothetical protein